MSSNETEFVEGLIVKAPHQRAPEYVKASISIKREGLIAWLSARKDEWVNVQVKESRNGKWYAAVDNWKPDGGSKPQRQAPRNAPPAGDNPDDDIPF